MSYGFRGKIVIHFLFVRSIKCEMSYNLWFLNRHLFCNYFCVLFYILFLKEDHPKYVKFTKLDSVLSLLVIIKRVVEINKPRTSKIPPNHKLNSTKIKQILRLYIT